MRGGRLAGDAFSRSEEIEAIGMVHASALEA
jgi:hypothetical protein